MRSPRFFLLATILALLGAAHGLTYQSSEPFFNNDETRHVTTGVFFHDFFLDLPLSRPAGYAVDYYVQSPALGLLVWPPVFHVVEGLFMLVFGTSFLAARVLVGLFAATGCVYLFLLAEKTHDRVTAAVATLLFGFSPLVFSFSRHVMLEEPTLAFVLAAVYHFYRYLDDERRRDLWLAALASALAPLTRFDGVLLLPFFAVLLTARRRWSLIRRREVLAAMVCALLLVVPYYALTVKEYGAALSKAAQEGTSPDGTAFLSPENFLFYPSCLLSELGWFALLPALVGLGVALTSANRTRSWPYLALVAATYVTFTPLAELESRHSIYWIPAFAVLAADGLALLRRHGTSVGPYTTMAVLTVVGTAWLACRTPAEYVRGYDDAARYVVANTRDPHRCLFDSFLNGGFIYHVRRHDPERRLWVFRGDKVFYSVLSDPHAGYEEVARNKEDVLEILFRLDPEYVVVEEPQIRFYFPAAELLRRLLRERQDRFRLEAEFPLESNSPGFRGVKLLVYRNLLRNPNRADILEFNVLMLGRPMRATLPNDGSK